MFHTEIKQKIYDFIVPAIGVTRLGNRLERNDKQSVTCSTTIMFNSFRSRPTLVSIFHNPSSPPSTKALALLRKAATEPFKNGQPLRMELDVVENAPNADQLKTIMGYLKSTNPAMAFLSAHPAAQVAQGGQDLKQVAELARTNANALKWPVVVDWEGGRASVGDVEGVRRLLDELDSSE